MLTVRDDVESRHRGGREAETRERVRGKEKGLGQLKRVVCENFDRLFYKFAFFFCSNGGPFSSAGGTRLLSLLPWRDSSGIIVAVAKQKQRSPLPRRPGARQRVASADLTIDVADLNDLLFWQSPPRPRLLFLLLPPRRGRGPSFSVDLRLQKNTPEGDDESEKNLWRRRPLMPELAPALDAGGLVGLRGRGPRPLHLARGLRRSAPLVEGPLALRRVRDEAPADPHGEGRGGRPAGDGAHHYRRERDR